MPSENQLSLLTTNGLEHTVSVPANALQISRIWFPPPRLFGSGAGFEGCCFCEDRAFEKNEGKKRKKGFLRLDFFLIGVFAFKFQTQEAQIVPDISLKCSIPFAIKTNRYSTYIIGTK